VLFLLGLTLLVLLVRETGLGELLQLVRRVGWTFLLMVALYGGVHLLRTLSWRVCLGPEGKDLALGRALLLWVAGEAVAHMTFGWTGEAFRAAAARERIPWQRGLAALVVSRAFYSYAALVIMATSALFCVLLVPLPTAWRGLAITVAVILGTAAVLPLVARRRLLRRLSARVGSPQASGSRPAAGPVRGFVRAMGQDLARVLAYGKWSFMRLVGLNLLAAMAGVVEVYLVLTALGSGVDLGSALVVEGFGKALALGAFLVPGNVGVREGGTVLVLRLFEISAGLGIALVLVRRARAFVWVLIGGLLLVLGGFRPVLQAGPKQADSSAKNKPSVASSAEAGQL
jgi:uncharacterized protein (TIRG00374 family)